MYLHFDIEYCIRLESEWNYLNDRISMFRCLKFDSGMVRIVVVGYIVILLTITV
jgi:hypothetical protein